MKHQKSETLTKPEFCQRLAEKTGLPLKDVETFYDAYHNEVKSAVAEGKTVRIRRFGNFFPRRKPRFTVRNPQTGEKMRVSEHILPIFQCSKIFKESVKKSAKR